MAVAMEKLNSDSEPELRFVRMMSGYAPANVQTAVDVDQGIIFFPVS